MTKLIVFGGTGMIGRSVIEAASMTPVVTTTFALQRRPVSPPLPRVTFKAVEEFADLSAWHATFAQADAVIFALGVSKNAVSRTEYLRVTLEFPLEAARCLIKANPRATFVFVSGLSVDANGWARYARVKGEAEQRLTDLKLDRLVLARPAFVVPATWQRPPTLAQRLTIPLARWLEPTCPGFTIRARDLGRALVAAALDPSCAGTFENRALRAVAQCS